MFANIGKKVTLNKNFAGKERNGQVFAHKMSFRTLGQSTPLFSSQFRSFASSRSAPFAQDNNAGEIISKNSSFLLEKIKRNEEEENREVVTSSSNSSWLYVLLAALGFAAFSLVSADEKNKKNNKDDEKNTKKKNNKIALSPSEWRPLTLSEVIDINHNTKLFRFAFEDKNEVAGLTVASCLCVRVWNDEKKEFDVRPYTPTTSPSTPGHLDLIIKKYDNGKVTPKIFALKVGDKLEFQGPFTKIEYKPNMKKEIGMIAGGTGITPMLQVLKEILKNKEDKTKVSLIFANITEEDILLRSELDSLSSKYKNFKVFYTLDKPSENWSYGRGFVSNQMIKENLPAPSDQISIFVCGPDPMVRFLAGPKGPNYTQGDLTGLLSDLGYTPDQVFKF